MPCRPANPVVLVRGGHEYILNSAALRKWNITKDTPQQPGGRITRDANGELNGELIDRAKALVQLPPSPPLTIDALIEQHKKLNAAGLTSIRYPGASIEQYRLLEEMKRRGLLTIRVSQLMRVPADSAEKMRAAVAALNVKPDEGDEWLRVGGMKLGVDGGFEGGWMRQPYVEPWGEGGTFYGVNTMKQAPYTDVVKELNRLGWRVATHAVGDAAIDEVLAAYEAANAEKSIAGQPLGARARLHRAAGSDRAPEETRPRDLGAGSPLSRRAEPGELLGTGRARRGRRRCAPSSTPGFVVAGGTDSAVVPYPPLWVLYHFVTRDTISGGVLGADQKITRREALQVETINNAYLTFEERLKGSIEPGKLADLVVLPEDILTVPEKRIEQMQVSMTMVGGTFVYRRP